MSASTDAISQSTDNPKQLADLRACFTLLGHELHVIGKSGQVHYEVRRWGQCRTCSTLHDLQGFLAVLGDRASHQGNAE